MIEIEHICKSFDGDDRQVLADVSATFLDGQTNLVIGRSGSGKTVLMKCLVGLLFPDSGRVLYDGRDFFSQTKCELALLRREVGMLFQGAALFDSMSVLDNVLFPLEMFSSMSLPERRNRAYDCLERVGMQDAVTKMPGELSGGMQKRAAIARAIVLQPRYLFCDEPNSGLDPISSLLIDELIHSVTHELGMTTIINTHDMNSVLGIGESILLIHEGHVEWKGTKDSVLHDANPILRTFMAPVLNVKK